MKVELENRGERKRAEVNAAGTVYLGKGMAGEWIDVAYELLEKDDDHGVLTIPLPETLPKSEVRKFATSQGKTVEQYTIEALRRQMQQDIVEDKNDQ